MDKEGIILANPEGAAWDFAKSVYEKLIEIKPPVAWTLSELKIKKFSDGEFKIKGKDNVRRKEVYFIHDSSLAPSEWFTQLVLVNEMLKNSSAQEICDVLPYMRFARQDRKDESRVAVSMKAVAKVISQYANRVLTVDIHNPTTLHFFDIPADNLYSSYSFVPHLLKYEADFLRDAVVISPDVGALGRAKAFAGRMGGLQIALTYKRKKQSSSRDEGVANQEIEEMILLGNVEGKNCLIVDDILDTVGTAKNCADLLRQNGAKKVYGCFTHAVMSGRARENIKSLDKVYVSDTISLKDKPDNISFVSLTDLFAQAIYRTRIGESLSDLFK